MLTLTKNNASLRPASIQELHSMELPESKGPRHYPIRHSTLLQTALNSAYAAGYCQDYAQSLEGEPWLYKAYVGIERPSFMTFELALTNAVQGDDSQTNAGKRIVVSHDNQQAQSVQVFTGMEVWWCCNGCANKEQGLVARRKHTRNFNLSEWLETQFNACRDSFSLLDARVKRLDDTYLTGRDIDAVYGRMFTDNLMPAKALRVAYQETPRNDSAWALYNCLNVGAKECATKSQPAVLHNAMALLWNEFGAQSGDRRMDILN